MTPSTELNRPLHPPFAGRDLRDLPHVRFASALLFECDLTHAISFKPNDLVAELTADFPKISREDIYEGIALAWTLHRSEFVELSARIEHLERQAHLRVAA